MHADEPTITPPSPPLQQTVSNALVLCVLTCLLLAATRCVTRAETANESSFTEFRNWNARYRDVRSTDAHARLTNEGETLACQRRDALLRLIRHDPQAALERVLPHHLRRGLPPTVAAQLEQPVSGRGDFYLVHSDNFRTGHSSTELFVTVGGRTYRAHV